MNFPCKFRHQRSIRRLRLLIRVQNFGDLATFYDNYCILYSECLPYFHFRFVWPTDLESIPHASTPKSIISTKFEVDMTIHCRVIAFLSADTSRYLVTLTFDLLTLNSCSSWRVTWPTLLPSLKTHAYPFLIYEWYPLECVRSHCGSKTITFLESPTLICLFTMQLWWLYDESN